VRDEERGGKDERDRENGRWDGDVANEKECGALFDGEKGREGDEGERESRGGNGEGENAAGGVND